MSLSQRGGEEARAREGGTNHSSSLATMALCRISSAEDLTLQVGGRGVGSCIAWK